ncbi:ankyrin [Viridothelium virens]|uniref:Ankyrin n=1 Tax=Viridothelium virens TaxID=1048519 RepID=A0A6A6H943_VIRVR|nr:ankyrin [Viridothelium virens]
MTALQAACEAGNEKIIDILLQEGAEINADGGGLIGKSALAAASGAGHFGIVKKLLDLGADINQLGHKVYGYTALSAAVEQGDFDLVDYLVQRGAGVQAKHGFMALKSAISRDRVDVTSRLLKLGANVNAEVDGEAPVHVVCSVEMLNLLVAHGAQVNRPSFHPYGCTALQGAAKHGNLDLVKELIRLGSDIHAPGPEIRGRTALQSAASAYPDGLPIIKLLIDEYGADVNEARSSEEGYTSLEAACHLTATWYADTQDLSLVEFLLE